MPRSNDNRVLKPIFWLTKAGSVQSEVQRRNAVRLVAQWLVRAVENELNANRAA